MIKRLRLASGLLITTATIALFGFYLAMHPSLFRQLATTPPATIVSLLILLGLWFGTLVLIFQASLRICDQEIPLRENLLVNAYSSFLNYFLPGQGGPALRGLYMKARYKLPLRKYLFAAIVYYAFYAAVSALMLGCGVAAWWLTLIVVAVVGLGSYAAVYLYARRNHLSEHSLNFSWRNVLFLAFTTILQAMCQMAIYWVELNNVNSGITFGQLMSYTGAANFALFANITPGAIGIRESFLAFSQKLHHVTNANIVGANVLDRSCYIIFLAIVFCALLAIRGKAIFRVKRQDLPTLIADIPMPKTAAPAATPAATPKV